MTHISGLHHLKDPATTEFLLLFLFSLRSHMSCQLALFYFAYNLGFSTIYGSCLPTLVIVLILRIFTWFVKNCRG